MLEGGYELGALVYLLLTLRGVEFVLVVDDQGSTSDRLGGAQLRPGAQVALQIGHQRFLRRAAFRLHFDEACLPAPDGEQVR
ncbi:hypothetical protein CCS38_28775 [Streptomyces purpurogeneiscleroticus]|nr:hypothetical protein [Streptomyces purpurogeneiscleroticus]